MNVRMRVAMLMQREVRRAGDSGGGHEIELVPLLDIVTNVMLFLLATIATVFTSSIRIDAATSRNLPGEPEEHLTIAIAAGGYVIGSDNGYLQPDCSTLGRFAVAVPTVTAGGDPASLSRCLRTLRARTELSARFPVARAAIVSGSGELPYETLVSTLDAIRETRAGARDLFPNVRLSVGH